MSLRENLKPWPRHVDLTIPARFLAPKNIKEATIKYNYLKITSFKRVYIVFLHFYQTYCKQ